MMPEHVPEDSSEALKALRRLRLDEKELNELDRLLGKFNIWQALGLTRQEVRHSAFLRWLLDPQESHECGDHWLRGFLQHVITEGNGHHPRWPDPEMLERMDLSDTEVVAEWQCGMMEGRRIDVLIHSARHKLACVIENKVDSDEGEDQLKDYREAAENWFSAGSEDYRLAFVYLTKDGSKPRHGEPYYALSYRELSEILDGSLRKIGAPLSPEVRSFITQYLDMVRRHIVRDSEVEQLCREIYRKHRRALDEIYKHSAHREKEVASVVRSVADEWKARGDLILADSDDNYVRFVFPEMDPLIPRVAREGGSVMRWELVNKEQRVRMQLALCSEDERVRKPLEDAARANPEVFGRPNKQTGSRWQQFRPESKAEEIWITEDDYDELSGHEIKGIVERGLQRLREGRTPGIVEVLRGTSARLSSFPGGPLTTLPFLALLLVANPVMTQPITSADHPVFVGAPSRVPRGGRPPRWRRPGRSIASREAVGLSQIIGFRVSSRNDQKGQVLRLATIGVKLAHCVHAVRAFSLSVRDVFGITNVVQPGGVLLKSISLFTGAGGIDYGFEAAGFETVVAVEMDAACCATLRANRGVPLIEKNIHDVSTPELLETGELRGGGPRDPGGASVPALL